MSNTLPTAKERMFEILRAQPEDSSFDELLRELAFVRMVERGIADAESGNVISHEEVGQIIKSWQK